MCFIENCQTTAFFWIDRDSLVVMNFSHTVRLFCAIFHCIWHASVNAVTFQTLCSVNAEALSHVVKSSDRGAHRFWGSIDGGYLAYPWRV